MKTMILNIATAAAFVFGSATTATAQSDRDMTEFFHFHMNNLAPGYVMLDACQRDRTASLILDKVSSIVTNNAQGASDVVIAQNQWEDALSRVETEFQPALNHFRSNPSGEECDNLETTVVQALGEGV